MHQEGAAFRAKAWLPLPYVASLTCACPCIPTRIDSQRNCCSVSSARGSPPTRLGLFATLSADSCVRLRSSSGRLPFSPKLSSVSSTTELSRMHGTRDGSNGLLRQQVTPNHSQYDVLASPQRPSEFAALLDTQFHVGPDVAV
eukprot:366340-Chlamydomonas_euryale.AAC.8